MTTTQTETIGFGEEVLEQLEKERATLERGGMNVTVAKAAVSLALEEAKAANVQQEFLKHQLRTSTELTEARMKHSYIVSSGTVDMMMGAVEKTSPPAKVFQRLRSRIRNRASGDVAEPLPVPTPEAAK